MFHFLLDIWYYLLSFKRAWVQLADDAVLDSVAFEKVPKLISLVSDLARYEQ